MLGDFKRHLIKSLNQIKEEGLYKEERVITSPKSGKRLNNSGQQVVQRNMGRSVSAQQLGQRGGGRGGDQQKPTSAGPHQVGRGGHISDPVFYMDYRAQARLLYYNMNRSYV